MVDITKKEGKRWKRVTGVTHIRSKKLIDYFAFTGRKDINSVKEQNKTKKSVEKSACGSMRLINGSWKCSGI